jgi:hypothetical protein
MKMVWLLPTRTIAMRAKRNSPTYLVPNSSEGLPAIFFLRDLCESATMGFWPPETRKLSLNLAKKALKQPQWSPEKRPWQQIAREKLNFNPDKCPHCHSESLAIIKVINPERGPPRWPAMMAGNKAL